VPTVPVRPELPSRCSLFPLGTLLHFSPDRALWVMEKKKRKKRRKKPASKGARATKPSPAITELVSDIVDTLADKKFGPKLANKDTAPNKTKTGPIP
jgi:hypothetical protein